MHLELSAFCGDRAFYILFKVKADIASLCHPSHTGSPRRLQFKKARLPPLVLPFLPQYPIGNPESAQSRREFSTSTNYNGFSRRTVIDHSVQQASDRGMSFVTCHLSHEARTNMPHSLTRRSPTTSSQTRTSVVTAKSVVPRMMLSMETMARSGALGSVRRMHTSLASQIKS